MDSELAPKLSPGERFALAIFSGFFTWMFAVALYAVFVGIPPSSSNSRMDILMDRAFKIALEEIIGACLVGSFGTFIWVCFQPSWMNRAAKHISNHTYVAFVFVILLMLVSIIAASLLH
jgi:hypothetical protein